MRHDDIQVGEIYLFRAALNPAREHLVGTAFTVADKKLVYRRLKKGRRKVYRIFNEDGVAVRPEELGELPEDHCPRCYVGTFGMVERHENKERYECDQCGHMATFP